MAFADRYLNQLNLIEWNETKFESLPGRQLIRTVGDRADPANYSRQLRTIYTLNVIAFLSMPSFRFIQISDHFDQFQYMRVMEEQFLEF